MNNLKNRLLYLATGEFAAVCSFVFIYKVSDLGIASLVAFSLLIFTLLQGSAYWLYRFVLVKKRKSVRKIVIKLLSIFNQLNIVLILGVAISIVKLASGYKDLLVALGVWLFAIIEYINYYWYRLSYGKSGFNIRILLNAGLQKSSINKLISK